MKPREKTTSEQRRWPRLLRPVVALGALALAAGYVMAAKDGFQRYREAEMRVLAPDFEAPASAAKKVGDFTLPDRFGKPVPLSAFRDIDVLVINVWSSGCPVCRQEIPSLTELDRLLSARDDMALITVAIAKDWNEVASYFPKGTNLRILFDGDDAVGKGIFGTTKYPETFVLDKQRRIRARFDGARNWHSPAFVRYLEKFL